MIGFSPAITDSLKHLPELSDVTAVRFGQFLFEGKRRDLLAVDPAAANNVVDINLLSGSFDRLDSHSIFLHKDPARDRGIKVGDVVNVTMPNTGALRLRVAGIYGDSTYAGNYLVSLDLFKREYVTSDLDALVFARRASDVSPEAASRAVKAALASAPQVKLDDRASYEASQQAQFDSLLAAVNGLLGLALFIALLGIGNTLALSVLERTREIGLLRAVGMIRRQTRAMVLDESAMVAVFGAGLGVVVGLFFGAAVTTAMPDSVATSVAVPYATIAVIVVIAAICGLLAGFVPARRAARLDVLQAVAAQ
jgi:putative ABC transport system permease protein